MLESKGVIKKMKEILLTEKEMVFLVIIFPCYCKSNFRMPKNKRKQIEKKKNLKRKTLKKLLSKWDFKDMLKTNTFLI